MDGDHDTRLPPIARHVNRWGDTLGIIYAVDDYPGERPAQVWVMVGWPGRPKHKALIRRDRIVVE